MMSKTHIGKTFKKALAEQIPKGHPLYKVMNEHVIKLSYSTMPNMASKMGSHNNKVEGKQKTKQRSRLCSCPKTKAGKPFTCPFGKKCLEEGIVYKCTGDNPNFNYIGLTKGNLKDRISKHDFSFKSFEKEHKTTLSSKMREIKRKN